MSDSGLGFSVKRFIIFIVGSAVAILVFEGMGEVGGNMIKGQVSKTTSKYHPERNVEDRIKPAFVLEDKVAIANAADTTDALVADEWNAEGSCEQVIEGNDMLQFNLKEMKVSAGCASVTVTLKHTGVMTPVCFKVTVTLAQPALTFISLRLNWSMSFPSMTCSQEPSAFHSSATKASVVSAAFAIATLSSRTNAGLILSSTFLSG